MRAHALRYFRNLSIKRLMAGFSAVLLLCMVAVTVLNSYQLAELKVGGPQFARISNAKDLVADILPPPLYIVEAFLEVNILARDNRDLPTRSASLVRLQKGYADQRAKWERTNLPENIRDTIALKSHKEASLFWRELNDVFLPSVAKQENAGQIEASLERLAKHFEAHRAIIIDLVKSANGFQEFGRG